MKVFDMDYGIRISPEGVNVRSGADKDMVFTSKYSTLKGSVQGGNGTISVPQTGVTQTVTIPHGLGYIPMVQAFWNDRDGDFFDPGEYYSMASYVFFGGGTDIFLFAKSDSTNVYLEFTVDDFGIGGANVDFNYVYYIYIDKGRL